MTTLAIVKLPGFVPTATGDPYDEGELPAATGDDMAPSEAAPIAAIAGELRSAIFIGKYPARSQLPPRARLAALHGVSDESAGVALRMLRDEGLVTLEQGRGTFVCELTDYHVRVAVSRPGLPGTLAEERRIAAAADRASPAISTVTVTRRDGEGWAWGMTVRAADPARACQTAFAAVRAAVGGGGWDFAKASVSAEVAA